MTRALARELGEFGIGVNALAPGLTLSDTLLKNPEIAAFQSAPVLQSRSLKRDERPEDLEGALVFLASDESAFMTGQTVVVDGGSVFL
jgi:NAD(P)-dependent dehydrogenase (short-subunit alcohol dehydrogenase family)